MVETLHDDIVKSTHSLYASLPAHGKPVVRSNGIPEWTILASISIVDPSGRVIPMSLGTGVKCLPYTKLSEFGDTLHDCHAEILARRGFVRWLLRQSHLYTRHQVGDTAIAIAREEEEVYVELARGKFRLKEGLQIWLYISTLPCGDASTLYTSAHQKSEEASQWHEADNNPSAKPGQEGVSRGRSGYTSISTLRTKPGRPDSIPSISMSCSDKIASWSVLGVQGGLLANIFDPVYLHGIIVGGVDTPSDMDEGSWHAMIKKEMERSVWGRLGNISDLLPGPYILHRPAIHLSSIPFEHSKTVMMATLPSEIPEPSPSPLSISHLPFMPPKNPKKGPKPEIIADGGVLGHPWKQGVTIKEKGRSRICKLVLLGQYESVITEVNEITNGQFTTEEKTYFERKHPTGSDYQLAKTILRGVPGKGTSIKGLEQFDDILSTGIAKHEEFDPHEMSRDLDIPLPPFKGWLVAGRQFESFTASGSLRRNE
ncbi:uncharacterized protein I303_107411 [Kwoniella dejecticola CBS 10117]|uniref:A to I editase domain-containing protein n=1 Tax=Kwoniella dejecticola CBS 10117 TaxID=1296121 RepID=A0A1A5ZZM7_9TREE|nr:uncharacterized protein I303_06815 [Kwoniella dejecticola CBS 10117]OBR83253.1 hypothetical protein I303_06815 [Kwoniella dejecticola CBS 10117]